MAVPRVLELTLHPRPYELDADGVVHVGCWARYLEDARWDAYRRWVDAGVVLFARGVVRAQRWRWVGRPLTYGSTLTIVTHLGRVGRTSMDLVHRVEDQQGEPLAHTLATLVRLGEDGRPEPITDEVRALVEPSEHAFPAADVTEVAAWEPTGVRRPIVASDLDPNRHTNQAKYVELIHDGMRHAERAGALPARGRLTRLDVAHHDELTLGDEAEVRWGPGGRVQVRRAADDAVAADAVCAFADGASP